MTTGKMNVILATCVFLLVDFSQLVATEDLTKILLTTGGPMSHGKKTEIIDLKNPDANCQTALQDFPKQLYGAVGGLVDNVPVICGGKDSIGDYPLDCYTLRGRSFQPTGKKLSTSRSGSAAVVINGDKLLVTGDWNTGLGSKTTEYISIDGSSSGPDLPIKIVWHSITNINSSTAILTGGYSNGQASSATSYFNHQTEKWVEGPKLNVARHAHASGIVTDTVTKEKIPVVTGGLNSNNDFLDSSEILINDKWETIGEQMPKPLQSHSLVPFGMSVVIIGGASNKGEYSKSLYKFSCSNRACNWTKMEQEMSIGRSFFVAIPIPESLAKCKVNCQYSQWSDCNATCGTGFKTRKIQIQAQNGGDLCPGLNEMNCTSTSKCPVDCQWSPDWSVCNATCGPGFQSRQIGIHPKNGGKSCSGVNERLCEIRPCLKKFMKKFDKPSDCNGVCGRNGIRTVETMNCTLHEITNETRCDPNSLDYEKTSCEVDPCPSGAEYGDWSQWNKCSLDCIKTFNQRSTQSRHRTCKGTHCNGIGLTESRDCLAKLCKFQCPRYDIQAESMPGTAQIQIEVRLKHSPQVIGLLIAQEFEVEGIDDILSWNKSTLQPTLDSNDWTKKVKGQKMFNLKRDMNYTFIIHVISHLSNDSGLDQSLDHKCKYHEKLETTTWQCKDGNQSILASEVCNGVRNCKDGSDESAICQKIVQEVPYYTGLYVVLSLIFCCVLLMMNVCYQRCTSKRKKDSDPIELKASEPVESIGHLFNNLNDFDEGQFKNCYARYHRENDLEILFNIVHSTLVKFKSIGEGVDYKLLEKTMDACWALELEAHSGKEVDVYNCLKCKIQDPELHGWVIDHLPNGRGYFGYQIWEKTCHPNILLTKIHSLVSQSCSSFTRCKCPKWCRQNIAKPLVWLFSIFRAILLTSASCLLDYSDLAKDLAFIVLLEYVAEKIVYNDFSDFGGIDLHTTSLYIGLSVCVSQISIIFVWYRDIFHDYCTNTPIPALGKLVSLFFPLVYVRTEVGRLTYAVSPLLARG